MCSQNYLGRGVSLDADVELAQLVAAHHTPADRSVSHCWEKQQWKNGKEKEEEELCQGHFFRVFNFVFFLPGNMYICILYLILLIKIFHYDCPCPLTFYATKFKITINYSKI
jgi:hypothetical protein